MPPPKINKGRTERPGTRAEPRDSTTPEGRHDINDALEGRKFLEKHLLLCPPGEPPSHTSLATCLYQVSAMAGVTKTTVNAIRAVALLLEEMEDTQINTSVKEAFDSQITEFTSDMKMLIEDAKGKLEEHFKATEERLTQVINAAPVQSKQAHTATYASMLTTPPPHANPRIAAKEGIKARQFLLEGLASTKFSHTDVFQLKTELNNILVSLGLKKGKVRSVNKLRNGGALLEADSDEATVWLTNQENRAKFCDKLGPNIIFRARAHNLIAFNVPIAINPEDQTHRQEVCEANNLDPDTIIAMRWAKPVHRRSPEQRTAHLILTFTSADAANRSITNGTYICNRRCHTERIKKEPTRCLKCQGWNHFAKECPEEGDKCGNCAKSHRTSDCPTPQAKCCVSCKTDDHASWSRDCPTFTKKLSDFNDRNPENLLQYIPTADPWTWTASNKPTAQAIPQPSNRPGFARERSQPPLPKKSQAPVRRYDSYVPNYDSYVPNYDRSGKRAQDGKGGNAAGLSEFRPLTQEYINSINNEESSRPINPTPTAIFE
jgi:hypothetical protein